MKKFLLEVWQLKNINWKHWLFIFTLLFIVHAPLFLSKKSSTNLAVLQAEAFLQSRLDIPDYYWDASVFEGKYYVSFPPFPSIITLPFAAIFGEGVNSLFISILLTCLSMYLFERILTKLIGNHAMKKWLFLSFFFGTGYWVTLLTSHHINGYAHVVCTAMVFLLLNELLGKQRTVLIGLYFGFAFLSRQMTLFYGFIILYYLVFNQPNKKEGLKKLLATAATFLIICIPYFLFNYLRFHNFLETGYQYLQYESATIHARVLQYGLFNIHYFPSNFYYMFLKGHNILFKGNDLLSLGGIDQFGTSLIMASPFVIGSLKATEKRAFLISFWVTIIFILAGILLYHNNGWMQVNTQRFSLDFLPALMILVALGHQKIPDWLFRGLVIFAIGLNCFSFVIHALTT